MTTQPPTEDHLLRQAVRRSIRENHNDALGDPERLLAVVRLAEFERAQRARVRAWRSLAGFAITVIFCLVLVGVMQLKRWPVTHVETRIDTTYVRLVLAGTDMRFGPVAVNGVEATAFGRLETPPDCEAEFPLESVSFIRSKEDAHILISIDTEQPGMSMIIDLESDGVFSMRISGRDTRLSIDVTGVVRFGSQTAAQGRYMVYGSNEEDLLMTFSLQHREKKQNVLKGAFLRNMRFVETIDRYADYLMLTESRITSGEIYFEDVRKQIGLRYGDRLTIVSEHARLRSVEMMATGMVVRARAAAKSVKIDEGTSKRELKPTILEYLAGNAELALTWATCISLIGVLVAIRSWLRA